MFRNDCTDTIYRFSGTPPPPFGWKAWIATGWRLFLTDAKDLGELVAIWRRRALGRRALASLSDVHLRDIGLDRVQARIESSKPFWRA